MTFQIIKGDLFDPSHQFDGLAQGVNCEGLMGAGIAVAFRERWPEMYKDYRKLCNEFRDIIPGILHTYDIWIHDGNGPVVYNLFSQVNPGRNGDYGLLKRATLLMRLEAESRAQNKVGLPWIGCGIAGLEKHNVEHIFNRILGPSEVEFILVEQ
jgi:O-acetyl-ADP-ribose deacetylase (regulator of RNase III)